MYGTRKHDVKLEDQIVTRPRVFFSFIRVFFSSFSNRESNPRNQSSKIIKMDLKIHSIVFLCSRFMPNGECGAGAHLGSANCDGESRWNLSWKLLDVNILLSHSRHNSNTSLDIPQNETFSPAFNFNPFDAHFYKIPKTFVPPCCFTT